MVLTPFFQPMFVHIHIPIIDCRPFLTTFERLPLPVFPAPGPNDFIQNFGGFHNRAGRKNSKGHTPVDDAIPHLVGERYYFATRGALRFDALPMHNVPVGGSAYTNICRVRRLHTAGEYMNRYELGFELYGGGAAADEVVRYLLDRDFRVRKPEGGYATTTLAGAGRAIAAIFSASTTNTVGLSVKSVTCGIPCCVVELNAQDGTKIPDEAVQMLRFQREGIVLYHFVAEPRNGPGTDCWIIRHTHRHPAKGMAAKLRSALSQVHLECQTLRQAYPFLLRNASDPALDKPQLAEFICTVQARLLRATRFEIRTDKIVFTALRATSAVQPGMMEELVEMVRKLGNRYMTADFLQLLPLPDRAEWRSRIETELQKSWNPGVKAELEMLRELCTPTLGRQFAKVLSRCGDEIWDIAKSIIKAMMKKSMGL